MLFHLFYVAWTRRVVGGGGGGVGGRREGLMSGR